MSAALSPAEGGVGIGGSSVSSYYIGTGEGAMLFDDEAIAKFAMDMGSLVGDAVVEEK